MDLVPDAQPDTVTSSKLKKLTMVGQGQGRTCLNKRDISSPPARTDILEEMQDIHGTTLHWSPPPPWHINFLKGINQPRRDMWHPLLWILISRTLSQEQILKSLDVSQTGTTLYTFETSFGFFNTVYVHILKRFSRSILHLSRNENASIICEINTCRIAWLQHGLNGDTKAFWKYHVTW
jgi:hypothetical protein